MFARLVPAAVLLLVSSATVSAQTAWPKRAVPDSKLRFQSVATSTLPKKLREAFLSFDEFSQGSETLPESLEVCRLDLNRDGSPEYFVASTQSYSGGTARVIYQQHKNGYRDIAYIQGGFHLVARHNSYYQIECWGRAGGGQFTRTLERFERGRYRISRIEDWTDDDTPRFIRARDPKNYDHDER